MIKPGLMVLQPILRIVVVASLAFSSRAYAESPCILTFLKSDNPGDVYPENMPTDTQTTNVNSASVVFREVAGAMGLVRFELFAVVGMKNACAAPVNGRMIVYYDADWLDSFSGGDRWVKVGVIAHELGHLVHRHGPSDGLNSWQREYEADRFAGRVIAALGGTEDDARRVVQLAAPDADKLYPSRDLRIAAFLEGFRSGPPPSPVYPVVSDKPNALPISVSGSDQQVAMNVDGRIFRVDITDYQDGFAVDGDDILVLSRSVAVRLGRENDMFMFSTFVQRPGAVFCVSHLFVRLRDGIDIGIEDLNSGRGDMIGVTYGRNRDLFNMFQADLRLGEFFFDPSAPRTGRDRRPVVPVAQSIADGAQGMEIVDGGCQ